MSGLEYTVAPAAVTIGAAVQGSVGFGANVVAVPVIAVLEPHAFRAWLRPAVLGFAAATAVIVIVRGF